jgi:hypothetical protein
VDGPGSRSLSFATGMGHASTEAAGFLPNLPGSREPMQVGHSQSKPPEVGRSEPFGYCRSVRRVGSRCCRIHTGRIRSLGLRMAPRSSESSSAKRRFGQRLRSNSLILRK